MRNAQKISIDIRAIFGYNGCKKKRGGGINNAPARKRRISMKKLSIVATLILCVVMAMSLTACASSYGAIKKAFENEGYSESQTIEGFTKDVQGALEKEEISVQIHVMTKDIVKIAMIIEFKTTEDMKKAYDNNEIIRDHVKNITSNEDVKAFQKSLEDAGYAKGNCLVLPAITCISEVTAIVKKA